MEFLKKIVLLLISTAVSLVFFELGFRLYLAISNSAPLEKQLERSELEQVSNNGHGVSLGGLIRPSIWKDVVYELKPNLSVTFQNKPVVTNSLGMREVEVSKEKKPGTSRIIGLGDSIMFGWGVEKEETYLSVLAKELSKKEPTESLNFAVPGYNTAMEAALFQHRALEFAPDVLIIQFVNNDFDVPAFMMSQENPWDFSKSMLLSFIKSRVANSPGSSSALKTVQSMGNKHNTKAQKVLAEYRWMTGEAGATKAFRKIRELAPKTRIIILTGSKTPVQERMLKRLSKELNFELVQVGPVVDRYIQENKLENTKEARKKLLTVAPNDRHPNALGHRLIAQALLEVLAQNTL